MRLWGTDRQTDSSHRILERGILGTRQVREVGQRSREVWKNWPTSSGCETWISLPHDWKTKQTPKWISLPLTDLARLAKVHSISGAIKALAITTTSSPAPVVQPRGWAHLARCAWYNGNVTGFGMRGSEFKSTQLWTSDFPSQASVFSFITRQ